MRIIIGSDHRGFKLKKELSEYLSAKDYDITDVGPPDEESVDYPEYAREVGRKVTRGAGDFGIAICGSGVGICIAVNKVRGIRAGTAREVSDAKMMRKHNNANVLCIGADETDTGTAKEMVDEFLTTDFDGGRHKRRVNLIKRMEQDESR
ncbi:MAG: ribose 5-phosphate isomerase B [Elusimicrobiota bacterium]